jgi:hypothetical protein
MSLDCLTIRQAVAAEGNPDPIVLNALFLEPVARSVRRLIWRGAAVAQAASPASGKRNIRMRIFLNLDPQH